MADKRFYGRAIMLLMVISLLLVGGSSRPVVAQSNGPTMLHPHLGVKQVATGFTTPISLAFLGNNDFLVLEKNTGKVQRVVNGVVQSTVLDLAVNFASERGLLGIALHPNFPSNPGVYLYIQKIFSYGHRNSIGMAVDPKSGGLWLQENGDDTFSEINRVEPGMNGG